RPLPGTSALPPRPVRHRSAPPHHLNRGTHMTAVLPQRHAPGRTLLADLAHDLRSGWRAQAACNGAPPELFDPLETSDLGFGLRAEDTLRIQCALTFCAVCPVVNECRRERQRSTHPLFGVWAGEYVCVQEARRRWREDRAA